MVKTSAMVAVVVLAMFAYEAKAQNINTNTNTNTVTVGRPAAPPKAVKPPVKVGAETPSSPAVKPAKPKVTASAVNNQTVKTDSKSKSSSTSNASGGAGGAGGNASATGGSATGGSAAGGVATASAGDVNFKHERSAASPTAPSFTTAECSNAASGAITTGVFGLALGGTSDNVGCNARQDFSIFSANGFTKAAAASMCQGTPAQKKSIVAEGVDCAALVPEPKVSDIGERTNMCQEPVTDYDTWRLRQAYCPR